MVCFHMCRDFTLDLRLNLKDSGLANDVYFYFWTLLKGLKIKTPFTYYCFENSQTPNAWYCVPKKLFK